MNIRFHSSVIFVKNIEVSKRFYCGILNQQIDTDFGNNVSLKCGISLWQVPDWHNINKNFYQKDNPNRSLELYFETEDIQSVVEIVDVKNIAKYHDLVEEPWGQKTIRIFDPDQNLIEIGEKLEIFIKRMFTEGLSVEQIHKKSGVPLELIKEYIK